MGFLTMNRTGWIWLGSLVAAVACAVLWVNAGNRPGAGPARLLPGEAGGGSAPSATSSLGKAPGARSGWVPPEGDPVSRYRELRGGTAQARKDIISNFLALGHERNPYLLIEALGDPDPGVRLLAVESASALSVGEATAVLAAASSSRDADVREMTWSLAAPYPVESRVTIYAGALRQGDDTALAEAFSEMGIRPERPLFEMMLAEALRPEVAPERQARFLEELQAWLEPGGGEVPRFQQVGELAQWWRTQLDHYDEYLLRTDL